MEKVYSPSKKVYICEICQKNYKSYQTLWKHNKKFHNHNIIPDNPSDNQNIILDNPSDNQNIIPDNHSLFNCKYCNRQFTFNQNKWRHEKICIKTHENKIKKLSEENKALKDDMDELKKLIKDLLNKKCKMHYKTLQKINNSGNLNNNGNTNSGNLNNNGNTNSGNLNNNTINNTVNIMALGQENINDVLTKTEKMKILNQKANALPFMIEYVHFNDKFPQFKNIAITNSRNNYAHLYDDTLKIFKLIDKNELIDDLIDYRVCDIEEYYFNYVDELVEPVKKKIEELLENRGDNDHTKEKIKLLLFNNKHKIDLKSLTIDS